MNFSLQIKQRNTDEWFTPPEAIAQQEKLRKEKEALKDLVVALVKRLIELER